MEENTSLTDTNNNSGADASYVALFKRSGQISNDYWDVWTETKVCTRETTIGEIEDWYKQRLNNNQEALLTIELTKAST